MSAEKLPQNPILVARGVEKGEDPNTRHIDVWATDADYHALGAADRIIAYDPTTSIQEVNPDTGEKKILRPEKDLDVDTFGPEAQEALARELAQLPLRGDKAFTIYGGSVVEGEVVDYYTVEGVKYAMFDTDDGQRVNIFIDNLNPKDQAELAEAHNKQSILDQGHAELNAAEVEEPDAPAPPAPWSMEAHVTKKAKEQSDREKAEAQRGGLPEKALVFGREMTIVGIITDADGTERVQVHDDVTDEGHYVDRSELTFESPETSETPDTVQTLTSDLPKSHDKVELESYAETTIAIEGAKAGNANTEALEMIRKQNWNRMSDVAKDRATRYVNVIRQQRAPKAA